MYDHHIHAMAASLLEAGLATDYQQVQSVLAQYWADKVAVVWTTDDVHSIQDDFDEDICSSSLSEDQAIDVLQEAFNSYDANEGITWEGLRYWSHEMSPESA